jgi:hypothetical protein
MLSNALKLPVLFNLQSPWNYGNNQNFAYKRKMHAHLTLKVLLNNLSTGTSWILHHEAVILTQSNDQRNKSALVM